MKLNKWFKLIKDYPTATTAEKVGFRLNRAVRKLEEACENKVITFKHSHTSSTGGENYLWTSGPLAWHVVVSKTGYTGTLTFYDKRLNPTKKHLLTHVVDYLAPIDQSRSSMPISSTPLTRYLKDYFSYIIDWEEVAMLEKRKERASVDLAKDKMTSGSYPSFRIIANSSFNTSLNIKTTVHPPNVVPIQTINASADDGIANLDRQCRRREERLTDLLKEDKGILSYEQEHHLETLTRDRMSLIAQYRSNTLLDKGAVLPLVEEGLRELIFKLDVLEQAVSERQRKDIERTLQLIKER